MPNTSVIAGANSMKRSRLMGEFLVAVDALLSGVVAEFGLEVVDVVDVLVGIIISATG